MRLMCLLLLAGARDTVDLATAYFVPDEQARMALRLAAVEDRCS